MSDNLGYWYGGGNSSYVNSELPTQALPFHKKNDKWKRATMDSLERIGVKQMKENLKFQDLYRMVEGKMSMMELSDVIPHLKELDKKLTSMDIPPFLKHYDLIGIIVNALVGEYLMSPDTFTVTNIDEISTTEYERDKQELVTSYIHEKFQQELNIKLVRMGFNPDVEAIDFETEEEQQQYIEKLESYKEAMTPAEIEVFMNTSWRTKATIWAEHTLEADTERFYLRELDEKEFTDFLLTGRCFRHYQIGYDYYRPESWSPLNTFFSQDIDTKYVQDGEYAGRVHFYTPTQIITKYGHLVNKKQKDKLLKGNNYSAGTYDGTSGGSPNFSSKKVLEGKLFQTQIVPFQQYHDYNFALDLQNELGVPFGEYTHFNKDGTEEKHNRFLPGRFNHQGSPSLARELRQDLDIRGDLLQVTEAYWVSYQLIGYLNYTTENGTPQSIIVTDEILQEFLEDNAIGEVSTVSLKEMESNPQSNTIVWDYIKQVWKGVKINSGNSNFSEPLYLEVEPLEVQLKGDSNIYDTKLPITGLVDTSMASKIQPMQVSHNIAMNQLYKLMEKEIGVVFLFDTSFLPSEYKGWGDSEDILMTFRHLVQDTGLFPINTERQNLKDGGAFNQFAAHNLSYSAQIADRIRLSEFYKNKAFEQIGINPQRLGTPIAYTTADSNKQAQLASFSQTEVYFEKYSGHKKRTLEIHLNIAQHAQKEEKDISVFYTKSDSTKAYLNFTDPHFSLRKLGLLPTTNSKKRKELEHFKSYLLNNNTLGNDILAISKLFTTDTMVELVDTARQEVERQLTQNHQAQQSQMQMVENQHEIGEQREHRKWEREEFSKQKDRENRIHVKEIDAVGRAADKAAQVPQLQYITRVAEQNLKKQKQDSYIDLQERGLELELYKQDMIMRKDMDTLKLRMAELNERALERKSREKVAIINKN